MRYTRKDFVARAALTAAGAYVLVDELASAPARAAVRAAGARAAPPPEQHILRDVASARREGVEIVVPPRHHQLVTAKITVGAEPGALLDARGELSSALAALDRQFAPTPGGLGVTVAWGLPYFERFLPQLRDGRRFPDYLPLDRRASDDAGVRVPVVTPAFRFESDDPALVLEENDVAILFRSDSLGHVTAAADEVFKRLDGALRVTSIRRGFVGGGLPRRMAAAAGIPGADKIPGDAQLFLGFTSTQRSALAPPRLVNIDTLPGISDQWPRGYFAHGTTMHVSHIFEDLERWYSLPYHDRLRAVGRPGLRVRGERLTLPQEDKHAESQADVERDLRKFGAVGHSGALQAASRLQQTTYDNYGRAHRKGTSLILRADFNSLDNPFFWTADPIGDRQLGSPAASVHFVAFSPTTTLFHAARYAMEGRFADNSRLALDPRAPEQGFNSVLRTTHRQNFLVPPRAHRSFPLAELQ